MTSIADISQKLNIKYECTSKGCYGAQFTNENNEKALYATTAHDDFKAYTKDSVTYVSKDQLEISGSFVSLQSILKSIFSKSEMLKNAVGTKKENHPEGKTTSGIMIIW